MGFAVLICKIENKIENVKISIPEVKSSEMLLFFFYLLGIKLI